MTAARAQLRALGPSLCSALLVLASAGSASAKPLWNAGVETGVCGGSGSLGLSQPRWCNALHGDVLFLRERGRDLGLGPSLRIGSVGFDDLRLDAGLSLLVPVFDSFPLVLEAGPHLRELERRGLVKVGPGKLPRNFWKLPRGRDAKGVVRAAVVDEREAGW